MLLTSIENLFERAKAAPKHIVLAEGEDPRIVAAAVKAVHDGVASITLLGPQDTVHDLARAAGDNNDAVKIVTPALSPDTEKYAKEYYRLRQHKNIDRADALEAVALPLNYANMMVRMGDADGSVAGAVHASPDVIRSALQIIGLKPGGKLVSSLFLMMYNADVHQRTGGIVFADCGFVVDPDADELAEIAVASADSGRLLLGLDPKIAMLSFSTKGSASHAAVDKIITATEKLHALRPDLLVDGELQFDAAIDPDVGKRKAKNSPVAGQANVYVFPDLNAGNIGYKIAERVGKMQAIGPILQGLDKPANDLSRGSDIDAIYAMIAVTVLQA